MEAVIVLKKASSDSPSGRSVRPLGGVSGISRLRTGLDRSAKIWFAASVTIGAVLAIVLHAIVGNFIVDTDELSYGALGRTLGPEVIGSIWALLAFSASALVFYRYQPRIRGTGFWKGLRYGTAVAFLWLVGMLEGVSLFGNPLANEFLIGLSDALPMMIMSILLGLFVFRSNNSAAGYPSHVRLVPTLVTIILVFLAGRYLGYISGIVNSGHSDYPVQTFVWTLLMGLSVGVAFLLLWDAALDASTIRTATRFGVWIFGVNWVVFMVFIPLLFEGVLVDFLARVSLDIVVVVFGCYMALRWWHLND
jgi:hypothetical protein